jgi:hypothetical protein
MWEGDLEPFAPTPHDFSARSIDQSAASLRHNGLAVLRSALPPSFCERCAYSAISRLDKLLAATSPRHHSDLRHDEVCSRPSASGEASLRYDLAVPLEPPAADDEWVAPWAELVAAMDAAVAPVLAQAFAGGGSRHRAGCVVAQPGAPAQHVHVDGPERSLVNVFAPLVPVASNGTELIPGSHAPRDFAFAEMPWQDEARAPHRARAAEWHQRPTERRSAVPRTGGSGRARARRGRPAALQARP